MSAALGGLLGALIVRALFWSACWAIAEARGQHDPRAGEAGR